MICRKFECSFVTCHGKKRFGLGRIRPSGLLDLKLSIRYSAEMHENTLLPLASIFFLGIGSQWLAWRFHLPAIVTLIAAGLVAGPITGLIQPDELLGDFLQPMVSLSVAVILFEGGLSLSLSDLKETETFKSVRRLVVFGALVTWSAVTFLAVKVLGFQLELALLIGAILVVTGPTVILPLLRQVGLGGRVRNILKWEGMINDPIGAVLAIVVFESIRSGHLSDDIRTIAAMSFLKTVLLSLVGGAVGAGLLVICLKKYWIPDHLQAPLALGVALLLYGICQVLQPESGLAAVTVMGLFLAHARGISLRHIRGFKEDLSVLLISTLFIVLSARIDYKSLTEFRWEWLVFTLLLILVVRPLAVLVSTARSGLSWQEKVYLSAIGPRGIVAASIASVFALKLEGSEYPGAENLMIITFWVISGSVIFSGLVATPLARVLKLVQPGKGKLLMVGAQKRARYFAQALVEDGVQVLMVDSNFTNVKEAREEGLEAIHGDIISSEVDIHIDLDDVGALLAVTPNDEVNSLAVIKFRNELGAANVFRILSRRGDHPEAGRPFGGLTRAELNRSWEEGFRPRLITVDETDPPKRPLVILGENGDWDVVDGDRKLSAGDRVVALAKECCIEEEG